MQLAKRQDASNMESITSVEFTRRTSCVLGTFLGRYCNEDLTRSELNKFILDTVGFHVSDAVMSNIFRKCDANDGGTVSVKNLASFIKAAKESNKMDRFLYAFKHVMFSVEWWAFIFFLTALLVAISLNICTRLEVQPGNYNYYGMNALLYVFGCYAYVAKIHESIIKDLKLIELVNTKIVLWAESITEESGVASHEDMTPHEFFSLLEQQGLYLPYRTFKQVMDRIDHDQSGTITMDKIKKYSNAEARRKSISNTQFHFRALRKCFLSPDYWLNWGWVVGSVFFAIAAFGNSLSDVAALHINGVGCILYLSCALFQHVLHYNRTAFFLERAEELNTVFVAMVKEESVRLVSALRMSLVRSKSLLSPSADSEEIRQEVAEHDSSVLRACDKVFHNFAVRERGNDSDCSLNFVEIYDALTQFGFVIELDVLRFIFQRADVNGKGTLQPEDFVAYIFYIRRPRTPLERKRVIFKAMIKATSFWLAWIQVFGGFILVFVNYADLPLKARLNWSLAGNCCWLVPTVHYLYTIFSGHVSYYEAMTHSKIILKEAFSRVQSSQTADSCDDARAVVKADPAGESSNDLTAQSSSFASDEEAQERQRKEKTNSDS